MLACPIRQKKAAFQPPFLYLSDTNKIGN